MANEFDAAINLLIKARDDSGPAFSTVKANLGQTKSAVDLVSSAVKGFVAAGAVRELQAFAQAAHAEEASLARLANAVDNNGGSWERQRAQIEKTIEVNRRFAYSDNQLRDALTVLTVESGSAEEGMRRLTLAEDLARATGMDLYTASRLLGRVTDENIGVLKRWGITVAQGASQEELLAEVSRRTAGAAERYATTGAAQAERWSNQLENLRAKAGEALGPVANLANIFQGAPMVIGGATTAIAFFTKKTGEGTLAVTGFARASASLERIMPGLARGFGTAALLAGEFFGIIKLAEAGGQAGIPVLDEFSNKQGTGSFDMLQKIAEKKGWLTTFGLLKDELLGIKQPAETAAQSVDRLRASLGKFPDILGQISGKMSGKGGGGLAAAGNLSGALVQELKDTFGPMGIAENDPAIKYFDDILNNVVGLSPEQKYKQLGDQLYKRFHDKVQGELVDPLLKMKEEMDQPGAAGAAAISKYAAESGKTKGVFLKDFAKELADAEKNLAATDGVVKGLIDRGATAQKEAVEAFHARQKTLLMVEKDSVYETAGAYDQLNARRAGGTGFKGMADNIIQAGQGVGNFFSGLGSAASGVLGAASGVGRLVGMHQLGTDETISGPTWMHVGEQGVRERIKIMPEGVGGKGGPNGGLTIMPGAIVLNYGGNADKAAAARLSADVVDNVTEALRQGQRRIGDRSSPFAS